ncbi:MAG: adenylyl-sulfate kinase [Chlorobium sp.]|nr:adenylyl-sulfate kinase [Chlorobium sp.]
MSSKFTIGPASNNITHHPGQVNADHRCRLLGQRPLAIWFTGLSAAGKSTLAYTLERLLFDMGRIAYVLDGDNVRHGLNRDLGFSHQDRTENIRRIAEVARLMNDAGLIVLTAFISPYQADRQMARDIIGADSFFEVHVATAQQICEERDPKGIYKRAKAGQILEFTGVTSPYELPENPACRIDASTGSPDACARQVLAATAGMIALHGDHPRHEGV